MDNFHEETARRKGSAALYGFLYCLMWLGVPVFGLFAMFSLTAVMSSFHIVVLVLALIFGALAFACFYYKDTCRLEYDYTFTNGEVDIARVYGNARRKHAVTFRLRGIESAGSVQNSTFARYKSMRDIVTHNLYLNKENPLIYVFFIATKDSKKHLVVFEPSDTMIGLIKSYCSHGVWNEANQA